MSYEPGMDARSTRVAEVLNTPMLIASALTIPAVAINESHPGGAAGGRSRGRSTG